MRLTIPRVPTTACSTSFLGPGTTLIASERTGRRCLGLELDPRYLDVAVARWEAFTGETARTEAAS